MTEVEPKPEPEPKPEMMSVGGAVLLTLIAISGFMTVGLVGQMLKRGALVDPVVGVVAFTVGPLIALYVGLVRYAPDRATGDALGLSGRPRLLPVALAVLAGGAAGLPLDDLVIRMYELFPRGWSRHDALVENVGITGRAAVAIGAVVLIPLAHELLYRGLVQPALIPRMGVLAAIVTAAILHVGGLFMNPHALPAIFGAALIAGIAGWSGGVWAAIAAHVAARAARVLVDLSGYEVPGPGTRGEVVHLSGVGIVAGTVIALVALVALIALGRRAPAVA